MSSSDSDWHSDGASEVSFDLCATPPTSKCNTAADPKMPVDAEHVIFRVNTSPDSGTGSQTVPGNGHTVLDAVAVARVSDAGPAATPPAPATELAAPPAFSAPAAPVVECALTTASSLLSDITPSGAADTVSIAGAGSGTGSAAYDAREAAALRQQFSTLITAISVLTGERALPQVERSAPVDSVLLPVIIAEHAANKAARATAEKMLADARVQLADTRGAITAIKLSGEAQLAAEKKSLDAVTAHLAAEKAARVDMQTKLTAAKKTHDAAKAKLLVATAEIRAARSQAAVSAKAAKNAHLAAKKALAAAAADLKSAMSLAASQQKLTAQANAQLAEEKKAREAAEMARAAAEELLAKTTAELVSAQTALAVAKTALHRGEITTRQAAEKARAYAAWD